MTKNLENWGRDKARARYAEGGTPKKDVSGRGFPETDRDISGAGRGSIYRNLPEVSGHGIEIAPMYGKSGTAKPIQENMWRIKTGYKRPPYGEKLENTGGRLRKSGGRAKHSDVAADKSMIKKAIGEHDRQLHGGKHTKITLKRGGRNG